MAVKSHSKTCRFERGVLCKAIAASFNDAVTIYTGIFFCEAALINSSQSLSQFFTGVEKFSQNNKRQCGSAKTASVESLPDRVFKENPLIGRSAFPFLTSLSILSLNVYVFRSAGRSAGENSNCFPALS